MGKTYRRDSDRGYKNIRRANSKPKRVKENVEKSKLNKSIKNLLDEIDNEI